ncbi:kinase-like domain-containing protein [Aspergillus heterothallicus]
MTDWNVSSSSEEFLVDLCQKTLEEEGSIGDDRGIAVVRISAEIAVKIGRGVTASEAATQAFAQKELDPSIACVPKVYRYFRRPRGPAGDEYGYLFMQYIPGQNLHDLNPEALPDLVPHVVKIVNALGQISGSKPGPAGGGTPVGHIYGDHGAKTAFDSIQAMNVYMNKRLAYRNAYLAQHRSIHCDDSLDLTAYPLVLCHGDLCRRNIILKEDGSLCLLDWGYAGFYPRFFELVALKCTRPYTDGFEGALERDVEAAMELNVEERRDMQLVTFVRGANLRWSFDESDEDEHDSLIASLERHAGVRKGSTGDLFACKTEPTETKPHEQSKEDDKPTSTKGSIGSDRRAHGAGI